MQEESGIIFGKNIYIILVIPETARVTRHPKPETTYRTVKKAGNNSFRRNYLFAPRILEIHNLQSSQAGFGFVHLRLASQIYNTT